MGSERSGVFYKTGSEWPDSQEMELGSPPPEIEDYKSTTSETSFPDLLDVCLDAKDMGESEFGPATHRKTVHHSDGSGFNQSSRTDNHKAPIYEEVQFEAAITTGYPSHMHGDEVKFDATPTWQNEAGNRTESGAASHEAALKSNEIVFASAVTDHQNAPIDIESDEEDLTPLEYARKNGLCRNHLTDNLPSMHATTLLDTIESIADDSHLVQLDFGPPPQLDERLKVSRDVALFLNDIIKEDDIEALILLIHDSKNMKADLPLLKTSHKTDCINFAQRDLEIKLKDINLPVENSDEEYGEGMSAEITQGSEKEKIEVTRDTLTYLQNTVGVDRTKEDEEDLWAHETKCKRKNFPITPHLLPIFLPLGSNDPSLSSPTFHLPLLDEPESLIGQDLEAIEKNIIEQNVPTPARKLEEEQQNYAAEDCVGEVTVKFSDICPEVKFMGESSPPPIEPKRLQKEDLMIEPALTPPAPIFRKEDLIIEPALTPPAPIFQKEDLIIKPALTPPVSIFRKEDLIIEPLLTPPAPICRKEDLIIEPTLTPPIPIFRKEDLMIEPALTPPAPIFRKEVKFSENIDTMIIDEPILLVEQEQSGRDIEASLMDVQKEVKRQTEQEKLVNDSELRVEVQDMESLQIHPPWEKIRLSKDPKQLLRLQNEMIAAAVGTKPLLCKISTKHLRGNPFTRSIKASILEESQDDEDKLREEFISPRDEEVIGSGDLAWKREGLQILKYDNNGDEEIEPAEFYKDQTQDMASLVRKRKIELEQGELERAQPNQNQSASQPSAKSKNLGALRPKKTTPKPAEFMTAARRLQTDLNTDSSLLIGGAFSAANLLENFKILRGIKKQKLTDSSYLEAKAGKKLPLYESAKGPAQEATSIPVRTSPIMKRVKLPAPILKFSDAPSSIIMSSALLKRRALVKHLESLLPNLNVVERDFMAHNRTIWMPGSVTRSPIASPLDTEADMIVSPSTGIVLTTLQKIKQTALPGDENDKKSEIRRRIERVSPRYEKLAVIITEGRKDETTDGLDQRDYNAITEFIAYTLAFNTAITVRTVLGGEETLAKWIAGTIIQNRMGEGEPDLLADETHWELFLRRAGMNAYAAQVVVAEFKAPESVDPTSSTKAGQFGLTAFMEMSREERIARLGPICGRRVLERVSNVVDLRWE